MNKTLEGMARAICLAIWDHDYTPRDTLHPDARWVQALKAAKAGAGFLADNVSDEMAEALFTTFGLATKPTFWPSQPSIWDIEWCKASVSAALRAAAGDGK